MAGAVVGLLFIGCLKETHRLDAELHVEAPTAAWGVPLAQVALSTDDLPASFTESVASNGLGSAFVWSMELPEQVFPMEEVLDWPDMTAEASRDLTSDEIQAIEFLPSGEPIGVALEDHVPLTGLGDHEINRLEFTGGTLRCEAIAAPGLATEAVLVLPQLFKDGEPMELHPSSSASGAEVDLAGAVLLMAPGETELAIGGTVEVARTGTPIQEGAELAWILTWEAPSIGLFEGRLGALEPFTFTGTEEVNLPNWLRGNIGLSAPELRLDVEQNQGVSCALGFAGQILNASNTAPFQWAPESPPVLPAAPVPGTASSVTFLVNDATTQPPLGTWVSSDFRGIAYEAQFAILDSGQDLQFLTSDGAIALTPSVWVPFIGYASRIAWQDTLPCDLESVLAEQLPAPWSLSQVEKLTLRFQATNGLPLGLAVKAHFLDANGAFLDALFLDSTTVLEPAATSSQGAHNVPTAPGLSSWDLVFEGAAVEELLAIGVRALAIELTGCTSGALEDRPVAFGPGMALNLSLGLRADVNPSLP
jgi:hypothetical protein